MIIFDIRLGRFTILALREPGANYCRVTREGPGEFVFDLPFVRLIFENCRRADALGSQ